MTNIKALQERDQIIDDMKDLLDQVRKLTYKARDIERNYINEEFAKYGIKPMTTKVRCKKTDEIGEIWIVSAQNFGEDTYFSSIGRPWTPLGVNMRYYKAEFHPLKKNGEASERASKTFLFSDTIEKYASYFEVVDSQEE